MTEEVCPGSVVARMQEKIDEMAESLRKAGIAEYVQMMDRPWRVIKINLLAGLARGIGMAVGFALLGALLVYVLRRLVLLNLPVISDLIAEVIKMVQLQMQVP